MKQPDTITICLCSTDIVWQDKDANRGIVRSSYEQAKTYSPQLMVFPEMALTGFSMKAETIAEPLEGETSGTLEFFRDLAKEGRTTVVFGMAVMKKDGPRNAAFAIGPDGGILAYYEKLHLFSFAKEDAHYLPGDKLARFKVNDMTFGITICYDLRFPEIYSLLSRDCDAVINIANWPSARETHWLALLKARAIENQIFMLGVNRTGADPKGNIYNKSSLVYGPDGSALSVVYPANGFDIYKIDRASLEEYRKMFNTIRDKRFGLYKDMYGSLYDRE